jgi:AraC-like DNA-binding protein
MHTHNTYELIYFLGGNATHVIEDRKYKLKKGDLIIIRPLQHHFIQIDTPTDYERYNILFDAERHHVESISLLEKDLEVVNLSGNSTAEEIFQKMDLYRHRCDEETFAKLLSHMLAELFYMIHLFSGTTSEVSPLVSPLISKALHYINENLCTIRSIKEIAHHLFVSESYLFRLFKEELHQTPKKYIMEKRLLLAQQSILAGQKPTSVFQNCGFDDYATFYRNYVSFFGGSPTQTIPRSNN